MLKTGMKGAMSSGSCTLWSLAPALHTLVRPSKADLVRSDAINNYQDSIVHMHIMESARLFLPTMFIRDLVL